MVTDREAIDNTLDACAAAVEANDLNRLLECISPSAAQVRADARFVLDRFEVQKARITDLEITINRLTSPPTAKAKFRAIGTGRDRKGEFPYQGFAEIVTVELRLRGRPLAGVRLPARKPGPAAISAVAPSEEKKPATLSVSQQCGFPGILVLCLRLSNLRLTNLNARTRRRWWPLAVLGLLMVAVACASCHGISRTPEIRSQHFPPRSHAGEADRFRQPRTRERWTATVSRFTRTRNSSLS